MHSVLTSLFRLVSRICPRLKPALWRAFYEYLAVRYDDADGVFMNLGFAHLDADAPRLPLSASDEIDRLSIELYHQVIEPVSLRGLAILEVSCGRGGGASYIRRYLTPRVVVGLDVSHGALARAARHHAGTGLRLCQGDAEALPFAPGAFDAVVNVEASHCYRSVPRFLSEVSRVLRPHGYLLLADLRDKGDVGLLRGQFTRAGFTLFRERVMSRNVLAAMRLDSERKSALIRRRVPRVLRGSFQQFAGVIGSRLYEMLRLDRSEYVTFALKKGAS